MSVGSTQESKIAMLKNFPFSSQDPFTVECNYFSLIVSAKSYCFSACQEFGIRFTLIRQI